MKFFRSIFTFLLLALFSASGYNVYADPVSTKLFFRINTSEVDNEWMNNLEAISQISSALNEKTPTQIRIKASASPDGPTELNSQLANARAQSVVHFIKNACPSLPDSLIKVTVIEEDIDGAIYIIGKSGQIWADEAVNILRRQVANPEEALRHKNGGKIWKYLAENVFPQLRRTEIEFVFDTETGAAALPGAGESISGTDDSISGTSDGLSNTKIGPDRQSLPSWAYLVMGFLGGTAATLGFLYARERKKNRLASQGSQTGTSSEPGTGPVPEPAPEPVGPTGGAVDIPAVDIPAVDIPEEPISPIQQPVNQPSVIQPSVSQPVIDPLASAGAVAAAAAVGVVAASAAADPDDQDDTNVAEKPAGKSEFAVKVENLINSNVGNPDYGVEQLASDMGISRIHLNRKLKAESISSPSALLKEARMNLAAQMITAGNDSMAEIAAKCGFATPSYFSTAFKDYYGVTPTEFITSKSSR